MFLRNRYDFRIYRHYKSLVKFILVYWIYFYINVTKPLYFPTFAGMKTHNFSLNITDLNPWSPQDLFINSSGFSAV